MSGGYRTLHRIQPSPVPSVVVESSAPTTAVTSSSSSSPSPLLPVWRVHFSPCRPTSSTTARQLGGRRSSSSSRLLVAGASNRIQCYALTDRTATGDDDVLDASALTVACTEWLVSGEDYDDDYDSATKATTCTTTTFASNSTSLGYAALDIVRNYCGEDEIDGDEVVMASKLGGRVCIWVRRRDDAMDSKNEEEKEQQDAENRNGNGGISINNDDKNRPPCNVRRPNVEFAVHSATGTALAIRPPSLANYYNIIGEGNDDDDDIIVALGCADGAVVLCKTSVVSARPGGRKRVDDHDDGTAAAILAKSTRTTAPGKIIASVGSGHACVLSLRFHPTCPNSFVVGRKDGTVDIYSSPLSTTTRELTFRRMHHLLHASSPVRALSFSCPDGALLFAGDDDGHLYSYDASCNNERTNMSAPVKLVACAITAHRGWVMDVTPFPDGRRLASCGSDRSVKVWDCGSGLASSKPVHSFEGVHDGLVWGVDCSRTDDRPKGIVGGTSSGSTKLASCGNDGVVQIFSCGE